MSPKIVFFGPPNAGKTTLRKIFFEQEEPEQLIINPLEPTQGIDRLILNYEEKIGVFDLAGQQYRRWLETEDKEVFKKTDVIVCVVSVDPFIDKNILSRKGLSDAIFNNLRELIKIKKHFNLNSIIFLLIHKIDLLDDFTKDFEELRINLSVIFAEKEISNLFKKNQLMVRFTSIVQDHLPKTYSVFSDILRTSLRMETTTQIDYNLLEKFIDTLHNTTDYLEMEEDKIIGLNKEGKKIIKNILDEYKVEISTIERDLIKSPIEEPLRDHPFLGFSIYENEQGLFIYSAEVFEGLFQNYLNMINMDLLTSHLNILDKIREVISNETNTKDLSILKFKRTNFNMEILGFEGFTVALFTLPNTYIKIVKNTIKDFFTHLFNMNEFKIFLDTNEVKQFGNLSQTSIEWLKSLNELYKKLDNCPYLYNKIIKKFAYFKRKYSATLEDFSQLKIDLNKAILEEDPDKIDSISKKLERNTII